MAGVAVAAFLLLAVIESYAVRSILDQVEREDLARRVHRARRYFERRAESKANLISEFSFWDDTWDMVNDPHSAASEEHIRENFLEWLPQRYGDRFIEIWDKRRQPVWSWSDTAVVGLHPDIERQEIFDRLTTDRLNAGYVRGTRGMLLVASALILHEWDQTLQGPYNGYLIAAEPIDAKRIEEFEDELQEQLQILPVRDGWSSDSIGLNIVAGGDSVEATFQLMGYTGKPVALVAMRTSRTFTHKLATSTFFLLVGSIAVGVVVLALLWRAANRLVVRPLHDIGGALEAMQTRGSLAPIDTTPPFREWSIFVSAFNGMIEALQSSEKRYQVLFDQAADAHFLLDAKTQTILEANPAAEALAGMEKREMIGRPFSTVLRLEPSPDNDGTFKTRRADGSHLTVGVATADLELAGAPRQLAALRDLTRNEALSAQLRQAQKMEAVGSLAGGIAHDFNNLLGAVLMASSTLREETAGNPHAAESIETIEQASRRAAELTRRLLSFARREQRRTTAVAINEVVSNVVRLCERTFDRAIRIEVVTSDGLPAISGDAGELEQALLNLCINARDAMANGGVLRLETKTRDIGAAAGGPLRDISPGSYVTVTVADTGTGLTAQAEEHLFEPFFTTKGQGKGTGLGLAMVYGLIRSHGGGIEVRNRPGKGVDFEIFLPVGKGQPGVSPPTLVSTAPRGDERLLIIDDEPALRSAISRALSRLGYSVEVAENGARGLHCFRDKPEGFDLVILDIVMPEMGGTETFHLIRDIRPDVPVLVCSGYSATADLNELLGAGANGFLQKPFDAVDLALRVREILDKGKSDN